MHTPTLSLLDAARAGGYAVGAFNVYDLAGVLAVVEAAESERSPVMIQIHPTALRFGGTPLVSLCLTAAERACVPVAVHLDHATGPGPVRTALDAGLHSVMADGSLLPLPENVAFTRDVAALAHATGAAVEAQWSRPDLPPARTARLTDPGAAADFVAATGADLLAVDIGNTRAAGRDGSGLDFDRLARLHACLDVPLVLHAADTLSETAIRRAIASGVHKMNVNAEVRGAYVGALRTDLAGPETPDLLNLLGGAVARMRAVVVRKMRLFGSSGRTRHEKES